jgi:signal transduction histidine kinase/predicted RNA-binding protein with RPS1 domain
MNRDNKNMGSKSAKRFINVRVIKHLPQGLSVVLDNGERGIIRTREISWNDDDIANWKSNYPIGWRGYAFSIPGKKEEVREFSLRLMEDDPWDELFTEEYQKGKVFEGIVTGTFEYGVFIEIAPGVSGLLHKSQVPAYIQTPIPELFWHRDKVLVSIREVDHEQRQIGLSLAPVEIFSEERLFILGDQPTITHGAEKVTDFEIPRRHILVVEDEKSQSEAVCGWLRELNQNVDAVYNAEEALTFLAKTSPDIALVDVGLPGMSGTDLTRYILENYSQVQVVNSTDWVRAGDVGDILDELQSQGSKLLFKPLRRVDLVDYLLYEQDQQNIAKRQKEKKLFISKFPSQNFKKTIYTLLAMCKKRLDVELVILFAFDSAHRKITIVEHVGDGIMNRNAIAQLIYSPVRDAAEDFEVVAANEIGEKEHRRFQYLLEFCPEMVSCIGVPVFSHTALKYALFAIDRRARQIGDESQVYVDGMALAVGAVLDQNDVRERLAMMQRSALIGNLASGMIHEINNLVATLECESESLRKLLAGAEKEQENALHSKLKNEIANLEQDIRQITNTVNTFSKIAKKPKTEVLRVDEIVKDTLLMLREISKRAGVKLLFNPPEKLVIVRNQAVVLEQIVLNVVLNAIQQIVEHHSKGSGCILVDMELVNETRSGAMCRILIRDNGPGIHFTLWEKIFEMGYSTRQDGSGIGLFVSRNLMEEIGGRIYVSDSHILRGSVFVLDVPIQL